MRRVPSPKSQRAAQAGRPSSHRWRGPQFFFARYVSWQPPQFLVTPVNAVLKLSASFTAEAAALASWPNFANLASKSALFVQIAGSAAVSPPLLEFSGNRP